MLESLRSSYRRFIFEREVIRACKEWISRTTDTPTLFQVSLCTRRETFTVSPLKSAVGSSLISIDYILREPGEFLTLPPPGREWVCIAHTAHFEFWERDRFDARRPIRLGLSPEEAAKVLDDVRSVLHAKLTTGKNPEPAEYFRDDRFLEHYSVDVAVWLDGYEHGSQIVWSGTLQENLFTASLQVLKDPRFKPLTLTELERAKLSITLLSDLRLPVANGRPEQALGYTATLDGKPTGIFLPAVFNVENFTDVGAMSIRLKRDKAGLDPSLSARAVIAAFPTENWVQSVSLKAPIRLDGTVPAATNELGSIPALLNAAAAWAEHHVESDGFVPAILDPRVPGLRRLDIVRLSLLGFCLASYAKETGVGTYIDAADRIAGFVNAEISQLPTENTRLLASMYHSQHLALTGKLLEAEELLRQSLFHLPAHISDSFLLTHVVRSMQLIKTDAAVLSGPSKETLLEELLQRFNKARNNREEISLAGHAELLTIAYAAGHPQTETLLAWLLSHQRNDGAFPNTTRDPFAYTRGTGKIIEAIASTGMARHQVEGGFRWLAHFQYTFDTIYYIPKALQQDYLGGIRHDAVCTHIWNDSVAHTLLAGARYLHNYPTEDPKQ